MSCDWPTVTLKDAGVTLIDCDHKTPKAQEVGMPYVGIPQLKEGRIILEGARLISEEDFHHWRRKAKPIPNDVILSRRCNPGETSYVPEGMEIALGQNLVLLRSNGKKLYPPFLRWVVQGSRWWDQVGKFINVGAVFESLKCADIPNFEIKLPHIEGQKKISDILGALDKKILLNRQTNQTLEQIAQAIFKSWFVDFEPTRAKIAARQAYHNLTPAEKAGVSEQHYIERAAICAISGKPPEQLDQLTPETQQQLKTTAALFPDALVESELGEVPEGWEVSDIGHEFDITMGQSPPGDTYNEVGEGMTFFQGRRDFGWRYPTNRVYCTAPNRLAKAGDTLLSVRAPVGDVNKSTSDCCIGRGISALRHKSGCEAYTYYSIQRLEQRFNSFDSEGTVFGSINQKDLKAIKVVKSDDKFLLEFSRIVSPIDDEIRILDEQITSLSLTRDSLLPKLLSGEMRIPEAEKLVETAE